MNEKTKAKPEPKRVPPHPDQTLTLEVICQGPPTITNSSNVSDPNNVKIEHDNVVFATVHNKKTGVALCISFSERQPGMLEIFVDCVDPYTNMIISPTANGRIAIAGINSDPRRK